MLQLEYNGKTYNSLTEFVRDNDLNYNAVYKLLQMGLTAEQIIARQNLTDIETNEAPRVYKNACEYNGKKYKTLAEAARDLGFSAYTAYTIKNTYNFSANETIAYIMQNGLSDTKTPEKNQETSILKDRRRSPCEINGIMYESKSDAMAAYQVPRFTVDARVQRGMSFEEAVRLGPANDKRIEPAKQILDIDTFEEWPDFNLSELSTVRQNIILKFLSKYDVSVYKTKTNDPAFRFEENLALGKYSATCWVVFNANQIEMSITNLTLDSFKTSLEPPYSILNTLNSEYSGIKIWMPSSENKDHSINIETAIISNRDKLISTPLFFSVLNNLIGAADIIARKY